MIISRTPFRLSLVGGGSDLREYYRTRPGAVVSMAIDQHMYVTVNKRFDDSIRVSYTKTQIVDHVDDLEHGLIREALKRTGITKGVEVTTVADLPAGIGLGSSSSLTVGVLNALHAYRGIYVTPAKLGQMACEIEIETLKSPIGKQDQYIAAYGAFQHIRFNGNETVTVEPIVCRPQVRQKLFDSLLLFYTGINRDAGTVLGEVKKNIGSAPAAAETLDTLVQLVEELLRMLSRGRLDGIGELLDRSWALKKTMGSKVTNGTLDRLYRLALKAGAKGGKVSGAGGGGCLLLYVERGAQARVRDIMRRNGLKEIRFTLDPDGSKIIFAG
jgi:D-glycero-alpha-D-manno-heptose-7-phosphate kinase